MAGLKSNPVDAVHSALGGSCLTVTGTVFFELSALRLASGKHTLSATTWNRSYAVCRSIHAEEMCRAIQATQNNQGWCSQVHQPQFSLNVPGTASPYQGHPPTGTDLVDPHHPWARLPRGQIMKQFLQWGNPLFYLRVMPKAVLYKPKEPRPDPPYSPPPNPWPKNRRINMALLHILPKTLHKSAVIRRAVVKKLKDVFMLVITRGADVQTDRKGNQLIVFKEEQAGGHWILEDWVYVVKPTLKLYQAPHAEIIQHVRTALYHISAQLKKGPTNPHLGVRPKLGVRSDGNNQTQYEKLTPPLPDPSRSNRPVMPGLQPPSSRDGFRKRTEAVEAVKLQPPRHNIGRIPRADSVKLSPPKGRSPSGDVSVGSVSLFSSKVSALC
ncbi:hypothetical protein PHLCEN_2v1740 [Hermanssonia centrifuga]|uniref:Uncharacterized protein n=1 Tax=Hermanssonia centrifuga TaxID=98765 RepID=A0A2R6RW57_9APHY|nr:hypothetical protein PHLCEN_2v1740 [Hermanssonia centrifuga]